MDECRIWCVPLSDDYYLIYAPYHDVTTLVNRSAADRIRRCLADAELELPDELDWVRSLRGPGNPPERKQGAPDPLYLGIIPTRACTMQCAYCDFASDRSYPLMTMDTIRHAVEGYEKILRRNGASEWHTHFFGGEPFAAFKEIVYAVNLIRRKAAALGLRTHFEVTTNGFYSEEKAHWIAENFDTVVLSFDGFPRVQDLHRPAPGGRGSFMTVCRNADIFAAGDCELIIRSCVSAENADDLPRWTAFLAERFFPSAVVLEAMIRSPLSCMNGLLPPDPDLYAKRWITAFQILEKQRIPLICSSGEISTLKTSLCPMGQDALIITPDGTVGGCWQLAENRQQAGIDLGFGRVSGDGLRIDMKALDRQRELSEENRSLCSKCFCYAHCAGGCLLNRNDRKDFCRMTRTLTLWQLLHKLNYAQFSEALLMDSVFLDWLTSKQDFSLNGMDDFPVLDHEPDPDGSPDVPENSYDFSELSLPPLPSDPIRGWLRDKTDWLELDLSGITLRKREGEDALRSQLGNSGLTMAEAETVLNALRVEADCWRI